VEINYPSASGPLSPEQEALLEDVRTKIRGMISSHGLTAADVKRVIHELRENPQVSGALMQEIRREMGTLMPGERFSFEWD
jgi:hypothetical protein